MMTQVGMRTRSETWHSKHKHERSIRTMIPPTPDLGRAGPILLALVVLIGIGSLAAVGPAIAASDDGDNDVKKIASIEFSITDEQFSIDDVHVSGPGLPSEDVDERTYTIEHASITSDGLTFTFQDTTYHICALDIVIEDVSFTLQDVSLSNS